MIVRIGIHPWPRFGAALKSVGAAGFLSANALRRRTNASFRHPAAGVDFGGLTDIALDSAGFVAMVRYGGYRWSTAEYVELAASFPWAWWASMDYCCEPEVASNRDVVLDRVRLTAHRLVECQREARERGIPDPVPVLQGWLPDDYLRCADLLGDLPPLVGLGSVCRRNLRGPDGVLEIVRRLDVRLPAHVKLHLFGVKGDAIPIFLGHPRIQSVDSMAWDQAARRELAMPRTVEKRVGFMLDWWRRQTSHANLFGAAV